MAIIKKGNEGENKARAQEQLERVQGGPINGGFSHVLEGIKGGGGGERGGATRGRIHKKGVGKGIRKDF